jgi:outer membrane beta-barrel protein
MTKKSVSALVAVLLFSSGFVSVAQAQADEEDPGQELIERVVVRNRLYNPQGRFEASLSVGLTFVTRLTDHYNFNLGLAYNFSDLLGAELRGGYALSRHTSLARQISEHLLQRNPASDVIVTDDLSNLWEMKANAVLGARWSPLYGKISLLAEVPVHFQTYLWAGLGYGTFHRESVVVCFKLESRADGICGDWLTEDKNAVMGSAAIGFRFFTHNHGAIKAEVRNWMFPDSFRVEVNRRDAEAGIRTVGTPSSNPGPTNLVLFDLGYSYIF